MTTISVKDLADVLSHFHPEEQLHLLPDGKLLTSAGEEVADFHLDEEVARIYLATQLLPSLFDEEYNINVMAMEGIHDFIEAHAEDIIAAVYERYSTAMKDYTKSLFLDMYAVNQNGASSAEALAENIVISDLEAALEDYPTLLDARMGIAESLLA